MGSQIESIYGKGWVGRNLYGGSTFQSPPSLSSGLIPLDSEDIWVCVSVGLMRTLFDEVSISYNYMSCPVYYLVTSIVCSSYYAVSVEEGEGG